MGRFGTTEIILILVIAILFFGASRIAGIGKGLGEGIRNFKKGLSTGGDDEDEDDEDAKLPEKSGKTPKKRKA